MSKRTAIDMQFKDKFRQLEGLEKKLHSTVFHAVHGTFGWNGSMYNPAVNPERFVRMTGKFLRSGLHILNHKENFEAQAIDDAWHTMGVMVTDRALKKYGPPSATVSKDTVMYAITVEFIDVLKEEGLLCNSHSE